MRYGRPFQGKKMGGTDGIFAPMLKYLLELMLEGELDNQLQESKSTDAPNRRNGKTRKTMRSLQSGEFELEDNVIAMYARGMSTRNIYDYVKEMYGMDISATEISNITDRIIPTMNE